MAKEYRRELKIHLSGGVPPTPPTSPPPPQPPVLPPPQRPQQDTRGTAPSALATNNRTADYQVQPGKTTQGLRPVRPPPPPPSKAGSLTRQQSIDECKPTVEPLYIEPDELHNREKGFSPGRPPPPTPSEVGSLTRQETIDDYKPTVEPLYIEPDELHIREKGLNPGRPPRPPPLKAGSLTRQESIDEYKTEPAKEPLYMDVLPDPFNTQPNRLHHSVSENPGGSWSDSVSPRSSKQRAAERQMIQYQLSLPARLPQGLDTTQKMSKEELEILLEWWNTTKGTESIYHQFDENNLTMISNEAHRVRLALHLFEGLMFFRCQIFNDHITQLYCLADKLDKLHKKTKIAGIAGGTSAAGGVAAIAGAVLAPLTFGASLAVTAVGIGVAVAGGVSGASIAVKNKMSNTKERKRVEEIVQNYKMQMEDVEACLNFISTGMECLMKCNLGTLRTVDEDAMRVVRLTQVVGSQSISLRANGRSSGVLDGFAMSMDIYFSKEDQEQIKKGSETKIARKIRELAKQLKSGLDQLMQIRDTVRSAVEQVVMW
ncbi:uncharacterized protein LOC134093804 isoform X2 [Sardina pilchardus]|uniref:uncharacterized protein LOC134093804 isoform X2 n=1 Tax=Sardina pilchardus TaxID=27697 RepID=UPI002E0D4C91